MRGLRARYRFRRCWGGLRTRSRSRLRLVRGTGAIRPGRRKAGRGRQTGNLRNGPYQSRPRPSRRPAGAARSRRQRPRMRAAVPHGHRSRPQRGKRRASMPWQRRPPPQLRRLHRRPAHTSHRSGRRPALGSPLPGRRPRRLRWFPPRHSLRRSSPPSLRRRRWMPGLRPGLTGRMVSSQVPMNPSRNPPRMPQTRRPPRSSFREPAASAPMRRPHGCRLRPETRRRNPPVPWTGADGRPRRRIEPPSSASRTHRRRPRTSRPARLQPGSRARGRPIRTSPSPRSWRRRPVPGRPEVARGPTPQRPTAASRRPPHATRNLPGCLGGTAGIHPSGRWWRGFRRRRGLRRKPWQAGWRHPRKPRPPPGRRRPRPHLQVPRQTPDRPPCRRAPSRRPLPRPPPRRRPGERGIGRPRRPGRRPRAHSRKPAFQRAPVNRGRRPRGAIRSRAVDQRPRRISPMRWRLQARSLSPRRIPRQSLTTGSRRRTCPRRKVRASLPSIPTA